MRVAGGGSKRVREDVHVSTTTAPVQAAAANPSAPKPDTVPQLLLRNAERHGSQAGLPREGSRHLAIVDVGPGARRGACAVARPRPSLVVRRGDTIAIIGDNRPQLYWAFTAAQCLGAIPVPVYQDSVADEMAFVLTHAETKFAIVENQEQVDKLMSIRSEVPSLGPLIYNNSRGLQDYDPSHLHALAAVQDMGRAELKADPKLEAAWLAEIARGQAGDVSVMLYTSGTTGRPKGVMLTHANVVVSGENANAFDHFTPDDTMIAYLPMAWVGDHIFSYGQAFAGALCVACPESPETATEDRREIGPTYFFAPPRVFENMLTQITVRMEDAGPIKRRMFKHFLAVARRSGEKVLDGRAVSLGERVRYALGNLLVYGPLRNRLGFSNLRVAYTAGEAIGPELFSFFRGLGINLKQLYGQTEASVFITLQPNGEVYPETVGKPGPGIQIRIEEKTGEVLFNGPGVFLKYYKNDEATAATKTADGWVRTGDAGFIDQRGHLRIIDRAKDVGRLNDGAMFAPKYLENRLKFYPEIKEAVTFGHGRDFGAAFINIDPVSVGNWAERNNVIYGSYQELTAHPEVANLVLRRIEEMNQAIAAEPMVAGSQIKRFLILHKELDADDGELTRTLKVRRSFIADRYGTLVRALYDGSIQCHIATEVTFEDGRKGVIEGDLKILNAKTFAPVAAPLREAAE